MKKWHRLTPSTASTRRPSRRVLSLIILQSCKPTSSWFALSCEAKEGKGEWHLWLEPGIVSPRASWLAGQPGDEL
jgi:hypothetical protein